MAEVLTPVRRGKEVIKLLNNPVNIKPEVTFAPPDLTDCLYFTAFPKELSASFPGSYIPPETFLKELGVKKPEREEGVKMLLSDNIAEDVNKSIYSHESANGNFGLTVWNGASNEYALALSRIAAQTSNFKTDEQARADYQHNLLKITFFDIYSKNTSQRGSALRIHDDCLASGDSIAGFLAAALVDVDQTRADNMREYGVEVVIDGAATAQGILFLKSFAQANGIKLHIDTGFLAFGLSAGKKNGAILEHANYITYPEELLKQLSPEVVQQLERYRSADENIYVVGDMGDAQKGISRDGMRQIRILRGDTSYCPWNDRRNDPHGDHQWKRKKLDIEKNPNLIAEDIYFPNGGYLPYEWDRMISPQFYISNKTIVDAARRWLDNGIYGAAFYEEGKKPR